MSLALRLYLLASRLAGPLAGPILRRRARRGKEDPARLSERLGHPGAARPAGPLVWLHAASVGEATSALPLVAALRDARPGLAVLMTTGTVTAARRMAEMLPGRAIHQFAPVDTCAAVRRFLGHWRPDLAIWVESEIWPRLIHETARAGTPMALVNARISEKSARGWARLPGMARALFGAFAEITAQDGATVGRLAGLGVTATRGANLKALVPPLPCDEAELARMEAAFGDMPLWLAASTHEGEEEAVAEAAAALPEVRLVLAPRHPERGDSVEALLRARGLTVARRSRGEEPGAASVYLADTLGEMGLWYRLAPVAFVGGSLVEMGGHSPFEPAALGCAVLHGPQVANFAPAYARLDAEGAAREVAGSDDLAESLRTLLGDPAALRAMTAAAGSVLADMAGDLAPLVARLLALVEPGMTEAGR